MIIPGELPSEKTLDAPVAARDWLENVDKVRQVVKERLVKIHEKESERYLKAHHLQQNEPGDRVWVKVDSKDKNKLEPLWMGPCEVLKHVHGGRYTVKTAFGDEDHHVDRMKPCIPGLHGKNIPFLHYQPSDIPEDDNWTVEKILKHKKVGDQLSWLVKWKGYDKPTWETADKFVGFTQDDWKEYNLKHKLFIMFH